MEYSDYLDNTVLNIESRKGLNNISTVRFSIKNGNERINVYLNHENVLKVINELNEIIEGDGN